MTQPKTKEPVRIREKRLANGNISLYLDIYINGKREYEFLRLYLIPERTQEDKTRNRETFAVMMLELGTDIYTVQKLLGHSDIHTTQIYARVLDKRKQEAVSRIPDLL